MAGKERHITFGELTDRLGNLTMLMHTCPLGSKEYIKLLEEYNKLDNDLETQNYT